MTRSHLSGLSAVPMTTRAIESFLSDYSSPKKKIQSLERRGDLIRLRRGLYVAGRDLCGQSPNVSLCANHIYGPSYVSTRWALAYYGMIPERVITVTSVTTKASRFFDTPLGRFTYMKVDSEYYRIGIIIEVADGLCYQIACREKALCDTVLNDRYVPFQSISALRRYLEEDLRLDMDMAASLNPEIIDACAAVGRKRSILSRLSTIIRGLL